MPSPNDTRNVTLEVRGMTCGSCQRHVGEALKSVSGVASVEVDLKSGRANIAFAPSATSIDRLIEAVEDSGYAASESL